VKYEQGVINKFVRMWVAEYCYQFAVCFTTSM